MGLPMAQAIADRQFSDIKASRLPPLALCDVSHRVAAEHNDFARGGYVWLDFADERKDLVHAE
jgi:hypothetical protein